MVAGSADSEAGSVSEVSHTEKDIETVIEEHLIADGYVVVDRDGFDHDLAIFPDAVLVLQRRILGQDACCVMGA